MVQYREIIIKLIVQSPDLLSVEPLIYNSLEKLGEKGTHPFIILRFIDNLKTSLNEIKNAEVNEKEWDNITQARKVLKNYEVKNLSGTKIKNN